MQLEPSRRTVLVGVTAGIASAVAPSFAWAASSDDADLVVDTVSVPGRDGPVPAYVARPKGKGPFPLVVVVHEIFGVHAWIQDVCRRLAREGFVAVAPYLYTRQGDVTKLDTIDRIRDEVIAKVALDDVLADLDATVAWAGAHARADVTRAAVTGFCWGGTVTWLYAAHRPDLKAGAAWYGKLAAPPTPLVPRRPVDVAPTLRVPVLGLYGGQDASIPLEDVEAMRRALAEGPSASEIVVWPQAGHGFLADYRPSFDAKASAEAWPAMLAWLKAHGAG